MTKPRYKPKCLFALSSYLYDKVSLSLSQNSTPILGIMQKELPSAPSIYVADSGFGLFRLFPFCIKAIPAPSPAKKGNVLIFPEIVVGGQCYILGKKAQMVIRTKSPAEYLRAPLQSQIHGHLSEIIP